MGTTDKKEYRKLTYKISELKMLKLWEPDEDYNDMMKVVQWLSENFGPVRIFQGNKVCYAKIDFMGPDGVECKSAAGDSPIEAFSTVFMMCKDLIDFSSLDDISMRDLKDIDHATGI